MDIEAFQEATRAGNIPQAKTDAIIVGNLTKKIREYEDVLTLSEVW